MRLSGLDEIERWVLNWSVRATVLEPPELVRRVRAAALGMAAKYSQCDTPPLPPQRP